MSCGYRWISAVTRRPASAVHGCDCSASDVASSIVRQCRRRGRTDMSAGGPTSQQSSLGRWRRATHDAPRDDSPSGVRLTSSADQCWPVHYRRSLSCSDAKNSCLYARPLDSKNRGLFVRVGCSCPCCMTEFIHTVLFYMQTLRSFSHISSSSLFIQCFDTVGWVMWPVKNLSPIWPIMCLVGR